MNNTQPPATGPGTPHANTPDPLDLVDRAAQSLENTPVPQLPSDLREQVLQQVREQTEPCTSKRTQPPAPWRFIMSHRFKYGLAAALVLTVTVSWLAIPNNRFDPNTALATMVEQVRAIRAMSATITSSTPQIPDPVVTRYVVTEDGRMSQTSETEIGGLSEQVFDFKAGKIVTRMHKTKQAMVMNLNGMPTQQMPQDFLQQFRQLDPEQASYVGKDKVDGIVAHHYNLTLNPQMAGEVWLDPKTNLPIKMVMKVQMSENAPAISTTTDNFVWLEEIDESRFSLEIPKGYTVQELNMGGGTEKDLALSLKLWSQLLDEPFPDEFGAMQVNTFYSKLVHQEDKLDFNPPDPASPPSVGDPVPDHSQEILEAQKRRAAHREKMTQNMRQLLNIPENQKDKKAWLTLAELSGRTSIFLSQLQTGGELGSNYQWVGAGVNPKTAPADTPLCYWQPKGSKLYKIIYADFSIKTIPADQLP